MKNKNFLMIMITFLCFTATACSSSGNGAGTVPEDANTGAMSETITDKNLKLDAPYIFVIDGKDMDGFWDSYLPEVNIKNEWFQAADAGYSIAISGTLKDEPEQGSINLISVDSDYAITDSRQILAPSKGGSLSIMDEESPKEFNMEAKDERGTVYLINFYNGSTAYKDKENDGWKYLEQ